MPEFDNTNRGVLWKNDRREKDSHPHFKGKLNVDGVDYWVSGWKRPTNANPSAPALSFSITKIQPSPSASEPFKPQQNEPEPPPEDDIPF